MDVTMNRSIRWKIAVLAVWSLGSSVIKADEPAQKTALKQPAAAPKSGDGALRPPARAGMRSQPASKRSWGPEQALGSPNTDGAGDLVTAWASQTPDGQPEWLICEYEKPLNVASIRVHETYNPGALVKVTAFGVDGKEVIAWEGKDPTARDEPRGVSVIPIALGFDVQRIKLYLDSQAVPGWNEIDAVAIEDENGKQHWAIAVEASSTFAVHDIEPPVVRANPAPIVPDQNRDLRPLLEKLQQDVNDLKTRQMKLQADEIRQLREEVRELKDLLKTHLKNN
jgi:hypothetical protein